MNIEILKPLRLRDLRLLTIGQTVSMVGDGVATVALAWEALTLTGNASGLGIVLTARTVPMLLLLLHGGAITDRVSRRKIMIGADVVRGICVAAMATLAMLGVLQLWQLATLAGLFGAADAFYFPASSSIIPEIATGEDLVRANALQATIRPLAMRLAGPAVGGVLVSTIGTHFAFWFDAATFAVSAGCVFALHARSTPERTETTSIRRDIAEGVRYTRSQPWLWATLLMAAGAVMLFIGPSEVLVPLLAKLALGGARAYGLIVAASGFGGIVGALFAPRFSAGRRLTRMYVIWGFGVLVFSALAFAHATWQAMIAVAVTGFSFEIGSVIWITVSQEITPPSLLGRVRSLDFLVSFALMPVSYALAAPISKWIGVRTTILASGVLATVITFAFMLYPHVLDPDRSDWHSGHVADVAPSPDPSPDPSTQVAR